MIKVNVQKVNNIILFRTKLSSEPERMICGSPDKSYDLEQ